MNNILLYRDKPVFGLDIGFSTLKAMQIYKVGKKRIVSGYGFVDFDPSAVAEGVIKDPEILAKAAKTLFEKNLIGAIDTSRVVLAIPAARTYNRSVQLPKLGRKELDEAVRLEAEQYIPMQLDDLYLDYEVTRESGEELELLVVAVPRKVIDSYVLLTRMLGLDVAAIETTIGSGTRLFVQAEESSVPTVLIDFGSVSSDITIYDQTLIVTGTVPGGGDSLTNLIADTLKVTKQEAHVIKTKYGLGLSKKQKEITNGLTPLLTQHTKEIRRMIRYYEERSTTNRKIGQVVTMGGGANMPGLSEYFTDQLRLPVRMCNPWQELDFGGLQPPNSVEKSMYITVAGLALLEPKEVFA